MIYMEDTYLTPEEVAQRLQLHVQTVKRLLRQGKMPGYKIEGSWRVYPEELRDWLKQRKNKQAE
jgi:excisionase family DNA binding protein